jgi:hypothetical protein
MCQAARSATSSRVATAAPAGAGPADVRLPAVYGFEEFARVGGSMAYDPQRFERTRALMES